MEGRLKGKKRSEVQLVQEVLAGNREAFGEIFRNHRQKAYGLAFQYTRNKEDALDVVQDAFIRAYRNLRRFDVKKEFGPWLLTIVRNLSIDHLRRNKRLSTDELPAVLPDRRPLRRADHQLLKLEVRSALGSLSAVHREIIFLKDYQGHSYAEIAEIMQIPLGTALSRMRSALGQLKAKLTESE